jgi:hypothetical protein
MAGPAAVKMLDKPAAPGKKGSLDSMASSHNTPSPVDIFTPRHSATPPLPVKGRVGNTEIATSVDSEIARYYIEQYLQNNRTDPAKDALIEEVERTAQGRLPTLGELEDLSRRFSVDFASLFLIRHIQQDPGNRWLQERYQQELAATVAGAPMPGYSEYVILFVPGFLYRQDPSAGADFARPRESITQLGLSHQLAEIDQFGSVEDNAKEIAREIIRLGGSGKKIVLVGASSAGPAIALALGEELGASEVQPVKGWVNVGGILRGSERADGALLWPRRWLSRLICLYKGWNYNIIASYTAKISRKRFDRLQIPSHVFIVNFIGIPLSGDVSKRAKRGYRSLRDKGPNDGLTLITDAIAPGSHTIAEPGLDHYFLDPAISVKTVALARTVLGHLNSQ